MNTKLKGIKKRVNDLKTVNVLNDDFFLEHIFDGKEYRLKMSFTQLDKWVYIDLELLQTMSTKQRKEYLRHYFDFSLWKIKDGYSYRPLRPDEIETLLYNYSVGDCKRSNIDYDSLSNEQLEKVANCKNKKELETILLEINEQNSTKKTTQTS